MPLYPSIWLFQLNFAKTFKKEIPPVLTYIPNQVVEGPFHTFALQMQS